jgi:ribosomal protein S27E
MPFDAMNSFITKPKCPLCGTPIRWGITTHFDKAENSEVCNVCRAVLNKE